MTEGTVTTAATVTTSRVVIGTIMTESVMTTIPGMAGIAMITDAV